MWYSGILSTTKDKIAFLAITLSYFNMNKLHYFDLDLRLYKGFTVSSSICHTSPKCLDVQTQVLTRHTELAQCTQLPTISPMLHNLRIQSIQSFPLLKTTHIPRKGSTQRQYIYKRVGLKAPKTYMQFQASENPL